MSEESASDTLGVVAILGVGLIGGSLGIALRSARAAREVVAWNRSPDAAKRALECGAADRVTDRPEEAVDGADVVVAATPVDVVVPLLRQVAAHLALRAVVTDVGSTKRRIVEEAEALLGGRFIGGHPMAGSEESGIAASSPTLFRGATWVLTPTANSDARALRVVRALATATGARTCACGTAEHDRWVAALSHLPHLAAYALASVARATVGEGGSAMVGGSFRDGTRVAESDPDLWTGIVLDNRDATLAALDTMERWLARARDAIDRGDGAALRELLAAAQDARRWFRNER